MTEVAVTCVAPAATSAESAAATFGATVVPSTTRSPSAPVPNGLTRKGALLETRN